MYFLDLINKLSEGKDTHIFVDMDGVIAAYVVNEPYNFDKKRPLFNRINLLEAVSKKNNITMHILSACKLDEQIAQKQEWLNTFAPFFLEENRVIISKEKTPDTKTSILKCNFLKSIEDNYENIILIDDDNGVLKAITKECKKINLIQDSQLDD